MTPTWGLHHFPGDSCLYPKTVSTHSQRQQRGLVQLRGEVRPVLTWSVCLQGEGCGGLSDEPPHPTTAEHQPPGSFWTQSRMVFCTIDLSGRYAGQDIGSWLSVSRFTILYSVRIIVNGDFWLSHKLQSWLPSNDANISGVKSTRGLSWLYTAIGSGILFKLCLASLSQVLCPPHQSFNHKPPCRYLPFSKLLPLHFVDRLPEMITDSVETEPSFISTNREISWRFDFPPSFLTCDSDFLSLTSFSLVLIPQLQPVPAHLPSLSICGHLSHPDLVISWPSSPSGALLSLHHKSLPWALQSFLLLFSKLSPICLHIYCFESPALHSVFQAGAHQTHREEPELQPQGWESSVAMCEMMGDSVFHLVRLQTHFYSAVQAITPSWLLPWFLSSFPCPIDCYY